MNEPKAPRRGARGPERDHATDRRVLEIRAKLNAWGFASTAPQIAAVLSFERETLVTADAVRARLRHAAKVSNGGSYDPEDPSADRSVGPRW